MGLLNVSAFILVYSKIKADSLPVKLEKVFYVLSEVCSSLCLMGPLNGGTCSHLKHWPCTKSSMLFQKSDLLCISWTH